MNKLLIFNLLLMTVLVFSLFQDCLAKPTLLPLIKKSHKRMALLEAAWANGLPPNQRLSVPHRARQLPRLATAAQNTSVVPLQGKESVIGEIYVAFQLGTPPVTFTAQLDTGSSDTAIPYVGCATTCSGVVPLYDPAASSTSAPAGCGTPALNCSAKLCNAGQCSYKIEYEDKTGYSANVFSDAMVFGGLKRFPQYFGGMYYENGGGAPFEPSPIDGIMGFAYAALSEVDAPTPMDNLVASGQIADIFSMCITDDGGSMLLGGTLQAYSGALQWTPIVPYEGQFLWYTMEIEDMRVNGASLGINASVYNDGGSIWDSGTTDVVLPTGAYKALEATLQAQCATNNLVGLCGIAGRKNLFGGYCFQMTAAERAAFPDIEVVYRGGGTSQILSKYWITDDYCGAGYYGLAIDQGPVDGGTILGEAYLKGIVSVTDRANVRLGFAPVTVCPLS